MSSYPNKLKPLSHKQVINQPQQMGSSSLNPNKALISKKAEQTSHTSSSSKQQTAQSVKRNSPQSLQSQGQSVSREVKTPMKMQRTSTKKIEAYDYEGEEDDFNVDLEELNSNRYFEGQIEKGIKQEVLSSTKKQPQNKALIVLPKIESEVKVKATKDLEKQMDLEMSRLMMDDHKERSANSYY